VREVLYVIARCLLVLMLLLLSRLLLYTSFLLLLYLLLLLLLSVLLCLCLLFISLLLILSLLLLVKVIDVISESNIACLLAVEHSGMRTCLLKRPWLRYTSFTAERLVTTPIIHICVGFASIIHHTLYIIHHTSYT